MKMGIPHGPPRAPGAKRVTVMLAVVVLASVYGCSSNGSANGSAPATTTTSRPSDTVVDSDPRQEWLLVAGEDRGTEAMLADAKGVIVISAERKCVFFDADEPSIPESPIVFPFGALMRNGDDPRVELPDGTLLRSGDRIEIHGGWVPESYLGVGYLRDVTVPPSCWASEDEADRDVLILSPVDPLSLLNP